MTLLGAVVLARGQGPGDGWSMTPAPDRSVKLLYWKLAHQSEVWTRITPKAVESSGKAATSIPASLVFSAIFKGEIKRFGDIKRPPDELTVLAQPSPLARVLTTSLVLMSGRDVLFDIGKENRPIQSAAPCDGCAATSVRAQMDTKVLERVTSASALTCEVLGMKCALERADVDALEQFARCTKIAQGRCDAR